MLLSALDARLAKALYAISTETVDLEDVEVELTPAQDANVRRLLASVFPNGVDL